MERLLGKTALLPEGQQHCHSADRYNERYDDFVNFVKDPKSYGATWNKAVGASDWNCKCLRWLATVHDVSFQDQLDYVERPRCGPGSEERTCEKEIQSCAPGDDPTP